MTIKNYEEFKNLVLTITSPPLNFTYADVHKDIGYAVSGKLPIRGTKSFNCVLDGSSGSDEWVSYIPSAEMPHTLNPAGGFIVSANQKITGPEYPHHDKLGNIYLSAGRATRLHQLFKEKTQNGKKISLEDVRQMQLDTTSIEAPLLIKVLAEFWNNEGEVDKSGQFSNKEVLDAIKQLYSWDFNVKADSTPTAIYEVFRQQLAMVLLEEPLGKDLALRIIGAGYDKHLHHDSGYTTNDLNISLALLENPNSYFVNKAGGKKKALYTGLERAITYLKNKLSDNPANWKWGSIHKLTFAHAMGQVIPAFSRGPYPVGGDRDTPNNFSWYAEDPYNPQLCIPSYRLIVDFSNLANSKYILPVGNCGHIGNAHYDDCINEFLNGTLRDMLYTEDQIKKNLGATQILRPGVEGRSRRGETF